MMLILAVIRFLNNYALVREKKSHLIYNPVTCIEAGCAISYIYLKYSSMEMLKSASLLWQSWVKTTL